MRIAGWARNLLDGQVKVFVQGSPKQRLDTCIWPGKGMPGTPIDEFELTDLPEGTAQISSARVVKAGGPSTPPSDEWRTSAWKRGSSSALRFSIDASEVTKERIAVLRHTRPHGLAGAPLHRDKATFSGRYPVVPVQHECGLSSRHTSGAPFHLAGMAWRKLPRTQ
ncbi:acylphosphatase [Paraburkholderia sp. A3BS-1L]|uniref:acylphosphatase n=1 Tax=Paraburkholderia sp. A3BS-1L TaxID=3028375 RepID=UPI003DA993CF